MTPCENYWEALNAFVDGECSPEEEATLRAHLTECEACREALAETETGRFSERIFALDGRRMYRHE